MLETYRTIKEDHVKEIEIKKSRFICYLKRIKSEDEAKAFISALKKEHWKANHHCAAFVIGQRSEIQRSSDDGEPSGTAGVPMLEVLKKNDLIDVAAVVVRYFGGIKLGAGGLIRAYAGSVAQAVEEVGIVEGRLQQEISVSLAYPLLGKLQKFLEAQQIAVKDTAYTDQVIVSCMIDKQLRAAFEEQVVDLLNGQVAFAKGATAYFERLLCFEVKG